MKKYQYLASWDDQTLTRVGEPVVVLGDSNVSQVEVTLPSNFLIDPTKAECRMYFLLPGEKESNHDVLETATKDENGDSHVTWTIKHKHSQKGGRLAFSLTLIGDDAQWDSRTAIIPVYESRYQPESEEAEEPYTGRLTALEGSIASIRGEFAEVQEDFEELKETATLGTPIPESLVANMTEGHVYIYTGTETGYIAGHVYYYVDGALKDGGVYGGTAVDATLTQSGQAADAKVTGEKIAEIKEDLSAVEDDVYDLKYDAVPLVKEFKQGTINANTGKLGTSTTRIFLNYTNALQGFKIVVPANMLVMVFYYTDLSDTSWQGHDAEVGEGTYIIHGDKGHIIRLRVRYTDDSAIVPEAGTAIKMTRYTTKTNGLFGTVSMFNRFGVCGASWDSGYVSNGTALSEHPQLSWGANVGRNHGITAKIYSKYGMNTRKYLTTNECLPALLADSPCGLYYIGLGGNDSALGSDYLGTIADITSDYTQNPDTFYGNYARIIEQIKGKAPNAYIVCAMYYDSKYHDEVRGAYYNAVVEIAEHYGLPYFNWSDDLWYKEAIRTALVNDHPSAIVLSGVALAFDRLFAKCAQEKHSYFSLYTGFDYEA